MVCHCGWWCGFSHCVDEIPEEGVEAGHASWDSFGHQRDLLYLYRHRSVGVAALTVMIFTGAGVSRTEIPAKSHQALTPPSAVLPRPSGTEKPSHKWFWDVNGFVKGHDFSRAALKRQ